MSSDPVSPVGAAKPELTISAPSLNDEPVELEGSPVTAGQAKVTDCRLKSGDLTSQESKVMRPSQKEVMLLANASH